MMQRRGAALLLLLILSFSSRGTSLAPVRAQKGATMKLATTMLALVFCLGGGCGAVEDGEVTTTSTALKLTDTGAVSQPEPGAQETAAAKPSNDPADVE